jgi:thioesterase domain-containing protein
VEQRRTELDDIINTQLFPTPFVKRMSVALRASQQYRPRPYLGQLTLLRATTRPLFSGFAPDLGWGELSRDGVEVMALPGNHDSILKPPHSQALASALCAAIRTGDKAR